MGAGSLPSCCARLASRECRSRPRTWCRCARRWSAFMRPMPTPRPLTTNWPRSLPRPCSPFTAGSMAGPLSSTASPAAATWTCLPWRGAIRRRSVPFTRSARLGPGRDGVLLPGAIFTAAARAFSGGTRSRLSTATARSSYGSGGGSGKRPASWTKPWPWRRVLVRLTPEDASAHDRLAYLCHRWRDLDGAAQHLEECCRLLPGDPRPLLRLAIVEQQRGRPEARRAVVRQALGRTTEAERFATAFLGAQLGPGLGCWRSCGRSGRGGGSARNVFASQPGPRRGSLATRRSATPSG